MAGEERVHSRHHGNLQRASGAVQHQQVGRAGAAGCRPDAPGGRGEVGIGIKLFL